MTFCINRILHMMLMSYILMTKLFENSQNAFQSALDFRILGFWLLRHILYYPTSGLVFILERCKSRSGSDIFRWRSKSGTSKSLTGSSNSVFYVILFPSHGQFVLVLPGDVVDFVALQVQELQGALHALHPDVHHDILGRSYVITDKTVHSQYE